ncbi:aminoacyl-tRNA hydrolase, partial [Xanthomonas citri pv. citri]|nr:aminoacyl-tRNA hydrolase [Xanthomonas citri pv. citri]
FTGYIPIECLKVSYMRSSGPGGQNVNKLNTKVDIRFRLDEASWLPDTLKNSLKAEHGHLLTANGDLLVRSDKTRSQHLNLADALDKLRATL